MELALLIGVLSAQKDLKGGFATGPDRDPLDWLSDRERAGLLGLLRSYCRKVTSETLRQWGLDEGARWEAMNAPVSGLAVSPRGRARSREEVLHHRASKLLGTMLRCLHSVPSVSALRSYVRRWAVDKLHLEEVREEHRNQAEKASRLVGTGERELDYFASGPQFMALHFDAGDGDDNPRDAVLAERMERAGPAARDRLRAELGLDDDFTVDGLLAAIRRGGAVDHGADEPD